MICFDLMNMRKLLKYAFVAAFVTVAGYGIYTTQKNEMMSDLLLVNVEALARYELTEIEVECGSNGGACWAISGDCYIVGLRYHDCEFCGYVSISCSTPCSL